LKENQNVVLDVVARGVAKVADVECTESVQARAVLEEIKVVRERVSYLWMMVSVVDSGEGRWKSY
jgi:hypothetical protein